jgi:imidazolonepropionase-like amidohydrolase
MFARRFRAITASTLAVVALLSLAATAHLAAAETVALEHVRLIDGDGGPPQEDATVLIEDQRIAAIGTQQSLLLPVSVRVIDLTGKTVLPGLISDHSHLGITNGAAAQAGNYNRDNIVRELTQWQRYGVTTVMSLGLNQPLFYALQAQAHAGTLPGADFFGADRGIGVPDGAPPVNLAGDQLYRPSTPAEARAAVDDMVTRRPTLIKLWVDDFHHTVPSKMSPEVYQAVIDEAHRRGFRVAAHVYYLADAKRLVADGVDVLAHGVRDVPVDDELIALLKAHGTWYIPTLGLDESFYRYAEHPELAQSAFLRDAIQPQLAALFADAGWRAKALEPKSLEVNRASLKVNEANLRRLYDAGIKIGFGTDSGATPLRIPGIAEHHELDLLVESGLTPLQAITLATRDAAALLQLQDRGTLAPGKRADLLVVDGNPASNIGDIHAIAAVWERGEQVAGPIGR